MMTLEERKHQEIARVATVYLRRQQLEEQRVVLQQQCAACDLELAKSDGRLEMLEELLKETP